MRFTFQILKFKSLESDFWNNILEPQNYSVNSVFRLCTYQRPCKDYVQTPISVVVSASNVRSCDLKMVSIDRYLCERRNYQWQHRNSFSNFSWGKWGCWVSSIQAMILYILNMANNMTFISNVFRSKCDHLNTISENLSRFCAWSLTNYHFQHCKVFINFSKWKFH